MPLTSRCSGCAAVTTAAAVSAAELKPLVAELRRQRAGMVQTPEQYAFCYQVRQPLPAVPPR